MLELSNGIEYKITKCLIHKRYFDVAMSTSKRYPRTLALYCDKCQDDWLKRVVKEKQP